MISVIIPSYNCARFITEALDSVLKQTRVPDQIIVVDDGSTDDTEQVVRGYSDSRIEYIKRNNGGIAAARNTGLEAARCEFITFLDADDRWRPQFVERMHGYLVQHAGTVCAFSNFVRFNHSTGEMLRDQFTYYPELRWLRDARIGREHAFSTLIGFGEFPAYTQVMMFRRELIDGMRFDERLYLGEDSNFALRTFLRGEVAFTDEVLAEVRRHDTNTTRDHREMAVHTLNGLKALAPHVTGTNLIAYHDRLVKAYINAALYQARTGRLRAGIQSFWDGLQVPGSTLRKFKGSVHMAFSLPRAILS